MKNRSLKSIAFVFTVWLSLGPLNLGWAQVNSAQPQSDAASGQIQSSLTGAPAQNYVLGPDDQISIHALDVDDIDPTKPIKIDIHGFLDVPIVGKVKAAGLTVEQLEKQLTESLAKYVKDPRVTLTVADYHSQPFSVFGAVNTPGVYSFTGANTLVQAISKAGGLRPDA
jgi:polysaccharide biosynthesis/export protein